LPRSACPLCSAAATTPSETQSVTPVRTTMHPVRDGRQHACVATGAMEWREGREDGRLTVLARERADERGGVGEAGADAVDAFGGDLGRAGDRGEFAGVALQDSRLPCAEQTCGGASGQRVPGERGEGLTVCGVPAVRGGADADGVEHDGLAVDVRVASCMSSMRGQCVR
jgi:hypothetical protein